MKKYPFIKQEGLKDCGPACLLMIIKFYKGYVPLEQLRELSKTTKYGTDAYHLIESAKKIGFTAKGIKSDLNSTLVLPIIAHVTIDNALGHYIVIYKINFKRKYLVIGDPAKGIYKISMDEFLTIWNNILIELKPERPIPIINETSCCEFLMYYVKKEKKTILVLCVSSIFITLFSCFLSFYFRLMIDNVNTSKSYLTFILLIFIIVYLLKAVMDLLKNKIFLRFKSRMDMNISCDVFSNIINLPYRYYRNRTTGEIISRFDDLEYVRQMLYRIIFSLFSDLPFIFGSLVLLFFINIKLGILTILFLILYAGVFLLLNPLFQKHISRIQEQGALTNSFMTEAISGFETIKNCSLEERVNNTFAGRYYRLLNLDYKFSNLVNFRQIISEIIYQCSIFLVVYFGALLVFDNNLSLGSLIMFYSILISFLGPLRNIIEMDLSIGQAKSALKRMLSIFIKNQDQGIIDNIVGNKIEFKNLSFYHNDIDLILDDINLTIDPSEKVLIVGNSGSGKSTLLKLIMKYYEANPNDLFIDDIDINNYTKEVISKKIGYISQQETLFTDSIMNNLGSDNINEILEISQICEIDHVMQLRNLNLHSMIKENGFNLSGGERQRIILGRLLLKQFEILLIDEGLNQMDTNLERRILKRIFRKFRNKTIVIVSHRLDNMDLYNHVIELSKGKVVKDELKNV